MEVKYCLPVNHCRQWKVKARLAGRVKIEIKPFISLTEPAQAPACQFQLITAAVF